MDRMDIREGRDVIDAMRRRCPGERPLVPHALPPCSHIPIASILAPVPLSHVPAPPRGKKVERERKRKRKRNHRCEKNKRSRYTFQLGNSTGQLLFRGWMDGWDGCLYKHSLCYWNGTCQKKSTCKRYYSQKPN